MQPVCLSVPVPQGLLQQPAKKFGGHTKSRPPAGTSGRTDGFSEIQALRRRVRQIARSQLQAAAASAGYNIRQNAWYQLGSQ